MADRRESCRAVLLNPPTAAPSSVILLNLAYLSSALKEAGHEVLVLDATAPHRRLSEAQVEREVRAFAPHFIGVTLTITWIPATYAYLERLARLGIPIVAGGPHANCLPEEILAHGPRIVAIGEGEETIVELADHFLGRRPLESIAGLCFRRDDGSVHATPRRPLIEDLDRIPLPDYASFPIAHYTGSPDPHSNPIFWSVFSSRGCPYNCIFCSSHNVFGRTYRARSPRNVYDEIEHVAATYGARVFAFQDDEAFINKRRIIEFCDLVREGRFPLKFSARLRIDSLDGDMLAAMKAAGFRRLSFGVESFNDETLSKINKKYTVATVAESFRLLEKADFPAVSFNNIIGFPWETPEHLRRNLDEIARIPPGLVYFSFTATPIPYPGTELYERYHAEYRFTDWWLDPARNSVPTSPPAAGAFFMLFLLVHGPLYAEDGFWRHSPRMKRAIEAFCWELSKMHLKRCLRPREFAFVYGLSRASHWLWRRSPRLERALFGPLVRFARRWGLDRKTKFTYRGLDDA
ncbi:MAG: radical SAM protein [Phycisphaerae bacterium]